MIHLYLNIKNYLFKKKLAFELVENPANELSDVWSGDFKIGQKITEAKSPITEIENINSFNFIRDLKSFGTIKTRALTRKIVAFWIDKNTNLLSNAFEYSILGDRISILCMTYSWFAKSGTSEFQIKLLKSISQQLKIQEINYNKKNKNKNNVNSIPILKSLIIGNIFLFNEINQINFYLKELENYANNMIIEDGGHSRRCPIKQFTMLRDLIEVRAATATINGVNTNDLHKIVNLMSSYFKLFCMPDNTFGYFNKGALINKEDVLQTKKRVRHSLKTFELASYSGYARISHKNLNLLTDVGNKNILNSNLTLGNKASLGAIELFYKKNKIITNLGDSKNSYKYNSNPLASSAAHSTLSIDDRNNIDVSGNRKLGFLKVKTSQNNTGSLVVIEHDGYKNSFGVHHIRTIFISKNGSDFRGEDQIKSFHNIGIIPNTAFIRFHISPLINIIKLQNGKILLKHKDGLISHFISSCKIVDVQDTVIFKNEVSENSKQIIIKFPVSEIRDLKILKCNWSFKFIN